MRNQDDRIEVRAASGPGGARPRPSARSLVLAAALLLVGAALGAGLAWLATPRTGPARGPRTAATAATLYQCPMHPTITADHPGDCPICGMKLVALAGPAKPAATGGTARRILHYRSPMDPARTSPVPRRDEMGMDYVPVYADEERGVDTAVAGRVPVTIDAARQQLIGLRTVPVTRGAIARGWRTVGRVEVDPTRVRRTNVKVEGYVERLFVDFVGQPVRRGQPLFSLYSPSLLAAENEYLLALRTREALERAGAPDSDGVALVRAARRKLELWDVPEPEIARLERTRTASRTLTFLSPVGGVVTAKDVVAGATLRPGDTPYEITDLGEVWVMADAYEGDLANVRVGMPAVLTLAAYPGRDFHGRVTFVDPVLDGSTRTAGLRIRLANPRGELKPGMFGDVVLRGSGRTGLRVPVDAVLRAGTRDVVFVAQGEGRFLPREVRLGVRDGDTVEVRDGLDEGQRVVTHANFLVDSESQLRAALAAMAEPRP